MLLTYPNPALLSTHTINSVILKDEIQDSSALLFCIGEKLKDDRLFAFSRAGRLRSNEQQVRFIVYSRL